MASEEAAATKPDARQTEPTGEANGSDKNGAAAVTLPMSGVMKCAKEGLNTMVLSADAKQAVHDAALVFISFVSTVSYERTKARKLKTMSADDIVAELHSLKFTDMATTLAKSVEEYRTRRSQKRQRASDTHVEAAPADHSSSGAGGAGEASSTPPKKAKSASSAPSKPAAGADLAGMWGHKSATLETGAAANTNSQHLGADGTSSSRSAAQGTAGVYSGDSDDEEAPASQEQLAELAAAFSADAQ